jgi:alkylation response protein AidB-like acyl-CoA dehydrogenase
MNFDLDADERALKDAVRDLVAGRVGTDRVRAAATTHGVDRALFAELAATGVLGLRLPEADGGLGLGHTHATVVFEELGRGLVPGPVVATHLAAGVIPGAADGTTVVGDADRPARVVAHLGGIDRLVVVDDDGLWAVDPAAVAGVAAERPLDPVTPVHDVPSLPAGERLGDAAAATAWRRGRTLLTSALLLGAALGATELMVAYAKEREQFGRAIGSFQAVKHLCADALTRAEVARAAVYAAACHLDDPGLGGSGLGDVDTALATAALLAGEAAVKNGKVGIQVHGGMGFTWEVDAHLYLKRAVVWQHQVGGSGTNAERVAAAL